MKGKIILLLLGMAFALPSYGWGKYGHATIAKVAEKHISPKVKKIVRQYLDGLSMTAVASDGDYYRGLWTVDLDYHPTNPDKPRGKWIKDFDFSTPTNIAPYSHCMTVDENNEPYRSTQINGMYIENAPYYIDKLSRQLKENARNMDPKERRIALSMVIHLVGDMHCPMHVAYNPKDMTEGHVKVVINGKEQDFHGFWDDAIFVYMPWSFSDMAEIVDNASKKEIKEICKGDVWAWGKSSAMACWPVHQFHKGDVIDKLYAFEMRPIWFSQLRNAGYRLATLLNDIFG